MRIAIVHDLLVEFGGAERVLLALLEVFPNADVYTAYTDNTFIKTFFPQSIYVSGVFFLGRRDDYCKTRFSFSTFFTTCMAQL